MNSEDKNIHRVREITDADRKLISTLQDLEAKSLETLEAGARQIITLVTGLMGLFLAVLAFKDKPSYLGFTEIKVFGILAAMLFIVSLFLALDVVIPQEYRPQSLGEMRITLNAILQRKRKSLYWASLTFGLAILFTIGIIVDLLIRQ